MKHLKGIAGLLLIVIAAGGIWLWETHGREALLYEEAIVASRDIASGEIISEADLELKSFEAEALISGALSPQGFQKILGKEAKGDIPKNAQISEKLVAEPRRGFGDGKSIFRLKREWIDNRSSSLRKGDIVRIYSSDGMEDLGSYELAFVKTEDEQEVESLESGLNFSDEDRLRRDYSDGIISQLEILCSLEEYRKIKETAEEEIASEAESYVKGVQRGLLIVQEGGL